MQTPAIFARNAWRSRSIFGLLLIGGLVAACGSSSPSASANATSNATSGATTAATTSAQGTATPAIAVQLPGGVQFSNKPETLPAGTLWSQHMAYSADGSKRIVIGERSGQIRAAQSVASGPWQDVLVDDGSKISGPAGYPESRGIHISALTSGPNGFAAVGFGEFWAGSSAATQVPLAWFSADGAQWHRINLSGVAGSSSSVILTSVTATATGFVAIGDSSGRDLKANNAIVVLTSPDGTNWTLATTLKLSWSLDADKVVQVGKNLLLVGGEEACVTGGYNQIAVATSTIFRAWSSADGGKTWSQVDSSVGGLFAAKMPMPTSAAGCPPTTDANYIHELFDMFGTSGSFVGVANGKAVFISGDGARVSTSADLQTFSLGTLAGGVPSGGVTNYSTLKDQAVVADGSGIALLSLQPRRDSADHQSGAGSQVLAWTSKDAANWTRVASARPVLLHDRATFAPAPNGPVALIDVIQVGNGQSTAELFDSVAGPLETWGACQPAPGADCSFAIVASGTAGADLSGADFTGATISSSLAGAKLTNARFEGAVVPASIFAAADLTGVDLTRSQVVIAPGDKTLENHDFGTLDLTGASFDSSSAGTSADMKGVNFKHATLSSTDFGAVDLTGATFPTTVGTSANFIVQETICPDGKPPTPDYSIAACRVGPPPTTP